jgi:hypothetical protein
MLSITENKVDLLFAMYVGVSLPAIREADNKGVVSFKMGSLRLASCAYGSMRKSLLSYCICFYLALLDDSQQF